MLFQLRNNDLEQRYAHGEKLSRLQSSRQEVWEQQLTKTSNMIMKYFLLLKGFNKVTNEMEMEYKVPIFKYFRGGNHQEKK